MNYKQFMLMNFYNLSMSLWQWMRDYGGPMILLFIDSCGATNNFFLLIKYLDQKRKNRIFKLITSLCCVCCFFHSTLFIFWQSSYFEYLWVALGSKNVWLEFRWKSLHFSPPWIKICLGIEIRRYSKLI